jgi:hypothetical protein
MPKRVMTSLPSMKARKSSTSSGAAAPAVPGAEVGERVLQFDRELPDLVVARGDEELAGHVDRERGWLAPRPRSPLEQEHVAVVVDGSGAGRPFVEVPADDEPHQFAEPDLGQLEPEPCGTGFQRGIGVGPLHRAILAVRGGAAASGLRW